MPAPPRQAKSSTGSKEKNIFLIVNYLYWSVFPSGSVVKNPPANAGDASSISGSGRFPGVGNGNPLQLFLSGKFHEWRSLVGCSPWGHRVGHDWATKHIHVHINMLLLTKIHILLKFHYFLDVLLLQVSIHYTTLHLAAMTHWVPLGYESFSDFSCFWRSWQFWGILVRYYRMPLNWGLTCVFLIIRLGLWVWRRKIRVVKWHLSHLIRSTHYQ